VFALMIQTRPHERERVRYAGALPVGSRGADAWGHPGALHHSSSWTFRTHNSEPFNAGALLDSHTHCAQSDGVRMKLADCPISCASQSFLA
jgi:hypothetical protein